MDRARPRIAWRRWPRSSGSRPSPPRARERTWSSTRGRLSRFTGTIPRINPLVLVDVAQAQLRLNRMARRVPLDAPWEAPDAERLDAQTAATWLRRNLRTRAAARCSSWAIEAVWAAEPGDMSLLHVLFYIHSAGSLELLFDTRGGAQQDRFVGGSQLVPLRAAEALGDERILLGAPVRRDRPRAPAGWWCTRTAPRCAPGARWWRSRRRWPAGSPTTRRCPATATSSPSACRWAR